MMKFRYFLILITIIFVMSLNYLLSNDSYEINKVNNLADNSNIKILEKYGYISGYNCNKITVVNEAGEVEGKYNLEDYVAGVVSGETHILDDEVTFEAMSVAIRTYALYVTNNCKRPIVNSEANQVMNNPAVATKKIKRAVAKTKGQLLTLNGKLVKAEYDSFYEGNGFYCDKEFCYTNYYKVGNSSTKNPKSHKVKVPASWVGDLSGGHGNGLSQYGAKYLSSIGYDYEKILKYFYADGTRISTTIKPNLDGLVMQDKFVSRKTRPLRNNKYYYVNEQVVNTLEGESVWYAASRANEILGSVNSSKKISYFDDSNKYCNLVNFTKVDDYTKPKEGAIISWGKHLAIIERVDDDTVDITEAYSGLGYYGIEYAYEYLNENGKYYNRATNKDNRKYNCEQNKSGCFTRINNIKISDLKNRWGYDFKCYIYLTK